MNINNIPCIILKKFKNEKIELFLVIEKNTYKIYFSDGKDFYGISHTDNIKYDWEFFKKQMCL